MQHRQSSIYFLIDQSENENLIGEEMDNLILRSDSYKYSHHMQFPSDSESMFYYMETREDREVKFFGLQYYLKKYLSKPINGEDISLAEKIIVNHGLPFNRKGWEYILREHDGYLPIRIKAVKEGSIVPGHNVLLTLETLDERCYWLGGFIETLLLKVWYPTTVATKSYEIKQLIAQHMEQTCDNLDKLPFMLHDFGYRGVSSEESAGIGGLAHLTNFLGTDTVAGLVCGIEYYNCQMAGFSIPASEHSTITSYGREGELSAYENMVNQFGSSGTYACVSDSYDFGGALQMWNGLSSKIKAKGGTLVVRPDSGDPVDNIRLALHTLERGFGTTVNSKGYKVLNNVAIIQGDKVTKELIKNILEMMEQAKFSADNIAFGMGGALIQGNFESTVTRDTYGFVYKCSAIKRSGEWHDVYKQPKGEAFKNSKRGRLDLIKVDDEYQTVALHVDNQSELITYFENGKLLVDATLEQIRNW